MWFCITLVRVALSLMDDTQDGSCECQTVVWPRMSFLLEVAKATVWSAVPKLKLLREGSVASHFMLAGGSVLPED